jgi:SAM-dependent methyltransferase
MDRSPSQTALASKHFMNTAHPPLEPSDWVKRWGHLLCPGARVLDVACGSGRHMQWLKAQGMDVLGVDRDEEALTQLQRLGHTVLRADLETGPWPFEAQSMDAVLVTHYLWRTLWPQLKSVLKPQGFVIYETFSQGHEALGRPKNPDFLLQPGELLKVFADFHIIAFEEGRLPSPPRILQRLVAQKKSLEEPLEPSALRSLE